MPHNDARDAVEKLLEIAADALPDIEESELGEVRSSLRRNRVLTGAFNPGVATARPRRHHR